MNEGANTAQLKRKKERPFSGFFYLIPVFAGAAFSLWYIKNASCDVIYSDYIRLIDQYLPNVLDVSKLLTADILTRVPASFLMRAINVCCFGYSVNFDRVLGAAGLLLCGAALARYCANRRVPLPFYLLVQVILFSLIKWEILLNGSAWAHVASFGLFFWNYELLDEVRSGAKDGTRGSTKDSTKGGTKDCTNVSTKDSAKRKKVLLLALPFLILLFAGEYIASYSVGMLFAYGYCLISAGSSSKENNKENNKENSKRDGKQNKKQNCFYKIAILCHSAVLGLYVLSRHFAVWEHAGATELSFSEAVSQYPALLPRFFVKTFAGAVLGQESVTALAEKGLLSDAGVLLIGALLLAAYGFAAFCQIKGRLCRSSLFPALLLGTGFFNHLLVTISRWIFLSEDYALSSRYAAQFMIGIIGIVLTFAQVVRKNDDPSETCTDASPLKGEYIADAPISAKSAAANETKMCPGNRSEHSKGFLSGCKGIVIAFCMVILAGNCYTTWDEIRKMPYREENFEEMSLLVRNYRSVPEEELRDALEWHKDAETLYRALTILEEHQLNVFHE